MRLLAHVALLLVAGWKKADTRPIGVLRQPASAGIVEINVEQRRLDRNAARSIDRASEANEDPPAIRASAIVDLWAV
jgi:hypothetical protein